MRAWRRREDGQRKRSPSHPRQVTRHFQQLSRLTAAFSDPISSDQLSNNTAHLLLVRDSSLQNLRHSVTPDARIYVPGNGDGSLGGEALPLPLFLSSLLLLSLFCCSLCFVCLFLLMSFLLSRKRFFYICNLQFNPLCRIPLSFRPCHSVITVLPSLAHSFVSIVPE